MNAPTPSQVGRYRIDGVLGRGGMGVVYRGFDPGLRRPVAIKMVLEAAWLQPDDLERFLGEARSAARLGHPGIVPIHEVGLDEHRRPFIVMGIVEGDSLETILTRWTPRPQQVVPIVRDVALALHHAHGLGVVHRDVKPANVLVDREGRAHLTDFGLARDVASLRRITVTGDILGTPHYMAPEQAAGDTGRAGPGIDIWALGAVLYRALVGRVPFDGDAPLIVLQRVVTEEPPRPRSIDPRIDPDLDAIVGHCLQREPGDRYATAGELAADLDRWLAGETIRVRAPGAGARVGRWVGRNRLAATLGAVAALLIVSALGLAITLARGTDAGRGGADGSWATLLAELDGEARESGDELPALVARVALAHASPDDAAAARAAEDARSRWSAAARARGDRPADAATATDEDARDPEATAPPERAPDDDGARAELERAKGHLAAGRFPAAIEAATGALARDPSLIEARRVRARARMFARELDGALEDLLAIVERDAGDAEAWSNIGAVRLMKKDLAGARAALDRALELDPDDVMALADRGRVSIQEGDLDRAAGDVRRALAIAPRETGTMLLLGRIERLKGELDQAAQLFDRAIAREPRMAVARFERAELAAAMGRPEDALADYRAALELDPRQTELLTRVADVLVQLGRIAEAVRTAEEAVARHPESIAAWTTKAEALRRARRTSEASADVARALRIDPRHARAHITRAKILRDAGKAREALRSLDEAVRVALADDPMPLLERGELRLRTGDVARATADYERALAISPRLGPAFAGLAMTKLARSDLAGALADARRATELAPRSSAAWTTLGSVLYTIGEDPAAAVAAFDRAIALGAGDVSAWTGRASARRAVGDLEGAESDLTRLITAMEGRAFPRLVLEKRVEVRRERGDPARAIADLERLLEGAPDGASEARYREQLAEVKAGGR